MTNTAASTGGRSGCLARGRGLFLLMTAIGVGAIGIVLLTLLQTMLQKDSELGERVPVFARWLIEHRAWLPLAIVPPAAIAVILLVNPASMRTGPHAGMISWLIFCIGLLLTIAVFAMLLTAFIVCISPLYQYESL